MSAREPDQPRSLQIVTLEVNGRPTLVFEAMGLAVACDICLDADQRSDLRALTSDQIPICAKDATLSPRPATQEEIAAFILKLIHDGIPTEVFLDEDFKNDGLFCQYYHEINLDHEFEPQHESQGS
jgi:hypothetical protein